MDIFTILKVEFGSLAQLAKLLGISRAGIYMWVQKNRIPVKQIKPIEDLSGGRITREMLRPELFVDKQEK